MKLSKVLSICLIMLSMACGHTSPTKDIPDHHTKNGFENTSKGDAASFIQILSWRFSKLFEKTQKIKGLKVHDPTFNNKNSEGSLVTWIGHSTVLLQHRGVTLITDPQFSMEASPVSWAGPERITPPAVKIEALPKIDIVVISHDHYDHLDLHSVQYLAKKNKDVRFFVPLGMREWFLDNKIKNVIELDWWKSTKHLGWHIEAVPAKHHSGRGLFDHRTRLWAGWVLKHPTLNFFYSGDTAYSSDFKIIGKKHGPFDLAAIAIGGYEPRELFKNAHVNPAEAVKVHIDIKSKKSIGVHWGTFLLTDEDLNDPPLKLRDALMKHKLDASSFVPAVYGKSILLGTIQ